MDFLNAEQKTLLKAYAEHLRYWNERINVISRKDIDHLEENHFLPVLPITQWREWDQIEHVIDVGTGGGIPGIILAILFPQIQFTLLDSIQKKITVVEDICEKLALKNVQTICARSENIKNQFDVVVGRAVTALDKFIAQNAHLLKKRNRGVFYWTGGENACDNLRHGKIKVFDLGEFYKNEHCASKKIIHWTSR